MQHDNPHCDEHAGPCVDDAGHMSPAHVEGLRMLQAQFDKITAASEKRVRKWEAEWFWMRVMLVLVILASVVVALWRIDK